MTSHPKLDHEVVSLVFLVLLHRDRCRVFGEMSQIDRRRKKKCFVFEEVTQSSSKKSSVSQKSPSMNVKPRRFFQVQAKSLFSRISFRNLARDASARCLRSRSAILINNEKQNLTIGVRVWRAEELCCKHYSYYIVPQ